MIDSRHKLPQDGQPVVGALYVVVGALDTFQFVPTV